MAFDRTPENLEKNQHELALRLDELFLNASSETVEGAIRFMAKNAREKLNRGIAMAERKVPGISKEGTGL